MQSNIIIRCATPSDITDLKFLWRQCFDVDEQFLSLFFKEGYPQCETFVLTVNSIIASALSLFPIKYNFYTGYYVYGVCTSPNYRGKGLAITLLHKVETIHKIDSDFFILRPASKNLFDYYRKQGYNICISRKLFRGELPTIPVNLKISKLDSAIKLIEARRKYQTKEHFTWSDDLCEYHLAYAFHIKGRAYSSAYTYFIGYPDSENPKCIICEEAGDIAENSLPDLIKLVYPNAESFILSIPSVDNKDSEEYLLLKTTPRIADKIIISPPYFTFTME